MDDLTDLHTHSIASDGTMSPSEIVSIAKNIGLASIALTDHDTIDGLAEFKEAGRQYGIETIAGIELAAAYKNTELHIIGLFIDDRDEELVSSMAYIVNERAERNERMIRALHNIGIKISMEELEKSAGGKIITRAHYANVMTEKGYVQNHAEAFSNYIGAGRPGYVKRKTLTPEKCIKIILNAGGVPILAHATLYGFNYLDIYTTVGELKGYGLMGMETIYSTYTKKQSREMKKICRHYQLLQSGGSDFHGTNKPGLSIGKGRGNLKIPQEFAEKMKKALRQ